MASDVKGKDESNSESNLKDTVDCEVKKEKKRPEPLKGVVRKSFLEEEFDDDSCQLLQYFPEEIWYEIFNRVLDPYDPNYVKEFENLRNASLFFESLLLPKRTQYLFPRVWDILATKYPTINEHTFEYVWTVKNFYEVQMNEDRLKNQKIVIDIGPESSCPPSKWEIGLKLFEKDEVVYIGIYCQLLENRSSHESIPVRVEMETLSMTGITVEFWPLLETFREKDNHDVRFGSHIWHFNQPRNYWHVIQPDGAVNYSIKFTMLNPIVSTRHPVADEKLGPIVLGRWDFTDFRPNRRWH